MTTAPKQSDDLPLAGGFAPATHAMWTSLVERVLKGAPVETLVSRSRDGLRLEPLYPKAEAGLQPWRAPGRWRIAQRVDHPDPSAANALALADLEGGTDALTVVLAGAPAAHGFGLKIETLDDLDRALSGVMLDLIHVRLEAGAAGRPAAALLVALARRRGHDLAALDIDLGLDPIGAMAATGRLSASWPVVGGRCAESLAAARKIGFRGRAFLCDGRPYHEAGASEAQELAAVLATGVAYLRAIEAGGQKLDEAREALAFLLAADADELLGVAKFRALRRLWARVEDACGLTPKPIHLHAETAWRMTTRRDPWVNMLRGTMASFSAGIGGADTIAVVPFTAALGLPDAFARRIARNTQLILLEECHLGRVADPAAGSGGFEGLTEALCEKAWGLFQAIEREGGIAASLASGALQARIATVRAERERAVATRAEPITGTSAYANRGEAAVAVLLPSPREADGGPTRPPTASAQDPSSRGRFGFSDLIDRAFDGVALAQLAAPAPGATPITSVPLPSRRDAEPFEALRDRSDRLLAETGARPKMFLANLGKPAAFAARAEFAKNLFEAGGFETFGNDADATPAAIAEAGLAWLRNADVKRVCLCIADDASAGLDVTTAHLLRDAGVGFVAMVGRPGDRETALRDAGVRAFLSEGCDVLAILEACSRPKP